VRIEGDGLFLAALGAGMVGACATLGFQLGAGVRHRPPNGSIVDA
jgi:hypothetical protein